MQGTLQLGNNLALQNSAFDTTSPGVLAFAAGVTTPTFGGLTGAGSLSLSSPITSLTLNLGSGVTQSYSGNLSGTTTLIMAGSGTQILSGTNSYTGGTSVTSGVLEAANTAALPGYPSYTGPNTVTVAPGATLAVQLSPRLEQQPARQPSERGRLEQHRRAAGYRYDRRQRHL